MEDDEQIYIGWTVSNAISALHSLSRIVLTPKSNMLIVMFVFSFILAVVGFIYSAITLSGH